MKKILIYSLVLFGLGACCRNSDVLEDGDKIVFNQTISASGVRYAADVNGTELILWNKGSDWTLYNESRK